MTNNSNRVLYVGVTSNLSARIFEHKNKIYPDGFTSKYHVHKLVYFETYFSIEEAIYREKQLKNWKREWKLDLIKKVNPMFEDLYDKIKEDYT